MDTIVESSLLPYVPLGLIVILLTLVYYYLTFHYGVLESLGIPVKKPYFCFGSVPLQYYGLQYYDDVEHMKKYGKFWGIYEGRTPEVYVSDPDTVKQMFVKDFEVFNSPRVLGFKHPMIQETIVQITDEKWKKVRSSLTPIFSSKRLRGMSDVLKLNADKLVNFVNKDIGDENEKVVLIKSLYDAFASDVTAACFFGVNVSSLENPDNDFVKYSRVFFSRFQAPKYQLFLSTLFPFMLPRLDVFDSDCLNFFRDITKQLITERKNEGKTYDDYVDTLLELEKVLSKEENKKFNFIEESLLTQGLLFFIAGFNTTSTTLTMATYLLAKHPEVQEKAYQEAEDLIEKYGDINHDTVVHLKYIPAIIDETLRLYPLVVRLERECQRDWEYKGLKVPKGVVVKVPVYAMHHSEKFFPDPEEFRPERFLKENAQHHPYSYLPFSTGSRDCLGRRFALEEQKLVLAKMLHDFRFFTVEETQLNFIGGLVLLVELFAVSDFKLGIQKRG